MNAPNLIHGKYCFVISESSKDEHGYIPCIAVEGDQYLYPMLGNGPFAQPWYWGLTYSGASEIARKQNARMGLTLEDEVRICLEGMRSVRGRRHG